MASNKMEKYWQCKTRVNSCILRVKFCLPLIFKTSFIGTQLHPFMYVLSTLLSQENGRAEQLCCKLSSIYYLIHERKSLPNPDTDDRSLAPLTFKNYYKSVRKRTCLNKILSLHLFVLDPIAENTVGTGQTVLALWS